MLRYDFDKTILMTEQETIRSGAIVQKNTIKMEQRRQTVLEKEKTHDKERLTAIGLNSIPIGLRLEGYLENFEKRLS